MTPATVQTTSSGTQSPPLEATGEDKPMGVSSVNASGGNTVDAVKDKEQRKRPLCILRFQEPNLSY